ncbi:MAG: sodium:solute symporter family protein [Synergistaceae bacterium]|jgi:SSS family solute:Na+ symporter|nr:sodium:solute symporter family protein [Synergistaceae bacterium]
MLNGVDNAVILIVLVAVVSIGFYFSKSVNDMESYYLANRSLPWSLVVGTLMASWYGGVGVIGTVGYASVFGLASWFLWSIGAHGVRFPLALWVGPRIHVRSDVTIPDVLRNTYGKWISVIGAVFLFVYCSQVGEITATGIIGEAAWGIDKVLLGAIIVAITIVLTVLGGLMGVAVTDMIFFLFMVLSVSLVFPHIYAQVGGLQGIRDATAADLSYMHPVAGMSVPKATMLILLCINVYADPTFYQRFSASNSARTGRRAMLTCFSIWICFDIITMIAGFIVHITNPDKAPELAYIEMVLDNLPQGFRALFIIGLFGAIISTLDSYYLIGGTTLAKDIYGQLSGKEISDKKLVNLSRVGAVVLGIIGLSLAFRFTLVYDAIAFMSSLWMSVAFAPVLMALMYKGKKTPMAGMLSMIVGCVAFALAKIYPVTIPGFGELEPLLLGLPLSFLFWFIGNQIGADINADKLIIS